MPGKSIDEIVYGKGGFSFNAEVSSVFDNMLERSIPSYTEMRSLCNRIGVMFASGPKDTVIDVGSSLGRSLERFAELGCEVHSIEPSASMVEEQRRRFSLYPNVKILHGSARDVFPDTAADLVLCVLTLQFMSDADRMNVLKNSKRALSDGGALIIVEKDESHEPSIAEEYLRSKCCYGHYSEEQVASKASALDGTMVPYSRERNAEMVEAVFGIRPVEFWRVLNFSASVVVVE